MAKKQAVAVAAPKTPKVAKPKPAPVDAKIVAEQVAVLKSVEAALKAANLPKVADRVESLHVHLADLVERVSQQQIKRTDAAKTKAAKLIAQLKAAGLTPDDIAAMAQDE